MPLVLNTSRKHQSQKEDAKPALYQATKTTVDAIDIKITSFASKI
jgi:hypothetical protein